MKTDVQPASPLSLVAPSGGVTTGVAVKIGDKVVVPVATVAEGLRFAGEDRGVFAISKVTGAGTGGAQGTKAYWTTASSKANALSAGGVLIGVFAETCADGDTQAFVQLDGAVR